VLQLPELLTYSLTTIACSWRAKEYFSSKSSSRHYETIWVLTFFTSSGEFHTFRLPVPSLWPDILQKVKAAGLNAVSVYTHMGLINPAPGVVDFDSFRALQPLYDAAKAAGIWVVLRPGKSTITKNEIIDSWLS
jgi:beta-galactosidase GanA